jgi:hypothetical protein
MFDKLFSELAALTEKNAVQWERKVDYEGDAAPQRPVRLMLTLDVLPLSGEHVIVVNGDSKAAAGTLNRLLAKAAVAQITHRDNAAIDAEIADATTKHEHNIKRLSVQKK